MTYLKHLHLLKVIINLLFLVSFLQAYAQNVPCRDWYFTEDRNGDKVKDKCMIGWQENDIGQKHGKYVYYKEDGATQEIAYYKNDVLNGRYVLYSQKDVTILDSGRYANGKKSGKWLQDGNCFVTYSNDRPIGSAIRKYTELQLNGSYSTNGLYNGKILIHEKTVSVNPMNERRKIYVAPPTEEWLREAMETRIRYRYDFTLPFPSSTCNDCVKEFPEEIVKRVYDDFSPKDFVFMVSEVSNGVVSTEKIQIWVNGKVLANGKEKVSNIISEINKEKSEELKQSQQTEERKRLDESGESMLDATTFGLDVINFQLDSYEPNSNGKIAIEKLIAYLKKLDPSTVNQLIIIGHAAADKELNKVTFDPKNEGILYDQAGRQTSFSEADLANLRMVLSLGRAKNVYSAIHEIPAINELISTKKFWMLPGGTAFGNSLSEKTIDQNIVQIIILTSDGHEINTLGSALPFGTTFKGSPVLKVINEFVRDLGYNFSKFIPAFMGPGTFAKPLPDYMKLATDPTNLAHFTNQYR